MGICKRERRHIQSETENFIDFLLPEVGFSLSFSGGGEGGWRILCTTKNVVQGLS